MFPLIFKSNILKFNDSSATLKMDLKKKTSWYFVCQHLPAKTNFFSFRFISLIFCVDVKWQISHQPSSISKLFHGIDRTHQLHLKTPFCDSWDIQVEVPRGFKALSCTTLCPVLVLAFVHGNFLVACICTWHHFLGVWLYSNYTIGHESLELVLCLILPSRLVESVSSTFILRCQPFLRECISRRGLLHYSEGSAFALR